MDYFEGIVRTLLEHDGYWVRQSHKVNVTKQEKRRIGKHSIPRPELDLLALKPKLQQLLVMEVKSFFDSPGVRFADLRASHKIPEGGYKLFTCENYRNIVFNRLRKDLVELDMIDDNTEFTLGLAAGNVYRTGAEDIAPFFADKGWVFWSPQEIKERVFALAEKGYENEPAIITAKILAR